MRQRYDLRRCTINCSLAGILMAATCLSTAHAAELPQASSILIRACEGRGGDTINQIRLAEALLIETRRFPSEFVQGASASNPAAVEGAAGYGETLVARLREIVDARGESSADPEDEIINTIELLEIALEDSVGSATAPLRLSERPGSSPWLFQSPSPSWTLHCRLAPRNTVVQEIEDTPGPRQFIVRAKPEELSLTGTAARSAGAFTIGFERTRSEEIGGTTSTDTTVSINGTLGVRLSSPRAATPSFAYARYSLQRARTDPPPTLPPGSSQSDDDTHALELGGLISTELTRSDSEFKIFNDTSLSAVFDFANETSRLKLHSIFRPAFAGGFLGLCRLGSSEPLAGGQIFGRCSLQAEIEAAKALDRGGGPIGDFDTFLAAGLRGKLEFFIPTAAAPGSGLLASVSYRWMPVLDGQVDDIDRFEAQLKHRFWTSAGPGIDVGFSYLQGRNELTFEPEDILRFGLGLIF